MKILVSWFQSQYAGRFTDIMKQVAKSKDKPDALSRVALIISLLTIIATPWTPYTLLLPAIGIVLSVFSLVKAHTKQLTKKYATISLAVGFAFLILATIHYQWYKGFI